MKAKRHHFSLVLDDGKYLNAYVPEEDGKSVALARVQADDQIWSDRPVEYHGLVEWFDAIKFQVGYNHPLISHQKADTRGQADVCNQI